VPWRPSQVHPSAMLNAACLHAHAGAVPHAAVCRPTRAAAYGSPSLGAFVSVCKDGEPPPIVACLSRPDTPPPPSACQCGRAPRTKGDGGDRWIADRKGQTSLDGHKLVLRPIEAQ
jgi:hypothetical protein